MRYGGDIDEPRVWAENVEAWAKLFEREMLIALTAWPGFLPLQPILADRRFHHHTVHLLDSSPKCGPPNKGKQYGSVHSMPSFDVLAVHLDIVAPVAAANESCGLTELKASIGATGPAPILFARGRFSVPSLFDLWSEVILHYYYGSTITV